MTSVAQQQSQNSSQATNAPTNSTVSYASATKKSVTTPPVATGSQGQLSAALAVSGNEPVQQNGKSTASPLNGRSSIAPAVPSFQPAVVHSNNDHTRQSPMTIAPHLANGGPVGGQKVGIQFGSLNSPAISHSTLQPVQSFQTPKVCGAV
jgi:translation initiation factor 4G